ncbi:MAG: patatin-like phospholipase family protein [Acidimicrobiales bacterium]|jgi:NTE family protein
MSGSSRGAEVVDLVLEGGGVKGVALVGAISALEEHGLRFARVAGSSAGAIVGALVAAGMTCNELRDAIEALDFKRICDGTDLDRIPLLGKGLSIFFEHGVYGGDYFRDLVADHLADFGIETFADLRFNDAESGLADHKQYKLLVTASDVTRGRLMHLPWDYALDGIDPDKQYVADAVRASMSIPFFFRPVSLPIPGHPPSTLIDGGLLSNFPVDAFDRVDGRPARWPTIGIKLLARQDPNEVQHVVTGTVSLAEAIFGTMASWHDRMQLDDPRVVQRTIFVDTSGVKSTDFEIDKSTQKKLFESGRVAAERFLSESSSS